MNNPLTVALGERSYPITFGSTWEEAILPFWEKNRQGQSSKVALLTDSSVWAAALRLGLADIWKETPCLILPPGEKTKAYPFLEQVHTFLAESGVDRKGALWILGGGVIGDLGGFAAATWLRGIALYQIPSTLLAMVDSSVGGKTGINHPAGKNLIGAFHQPKGVMISQDLLSTLPPREFSAGLAEVLKYGLLGDSGLWQQITAEALSPSSESLSGIIRRCCEIKAEIVAADEKELATEGGRALLNLGHTFAHALENVAGYGEYLHGEAVAIGLLRAARLSEELGFLPGAVVEEIKIGIELQGLPVALRRPLPAKALWEAKFKDKKTIGGKLRFVLLDQIGHAFTSSTQQSADLILDLWREVGAS